MEREKQVCSKESGNRLKELGVKQDSLFYWEYAHVGIKEPFYFVTEEPFQKQCSAFTVAELGEMFPDEFQEMKNGLTWSICRIAKCDGIYNMKNLPIERTEAEARAKMLIYLLENKLI